MELIVLFISVDIVASKFLDCYIKFYRPTGPESRTNLLLKTFFGKKPETIWLSFFLTVCVVGITMCSLNFLPPSFGWLYAVIGIIHITLNLGSAHSTYFGRKNLITQRIRK